LDLLAMAEDAASPPAEPVHISRPEGVTVKGSDKASDGENPLLAAARHDRYSEVQQLLEARADPEAREKAGIGFGWTALHIAAASGACASASVLLRQGASVEPRANDGEVPLHLAAAEGHTAMIRMLAEARADVNSTSADGETPLHVAVQHVGAKPGLGHIRTLLDLRADVSLQDGSGHTAHEVAGLYTNRADEIREILGGAQPKKDAEDPWPETPGELEAGTDRIDVAESLRELGNKRFRNGLYAEALKKYFKAKVFLPSGPDAYRQVDEMDENGRRARTCQIAVSSNAAACKLKLGEHDACVRMCDAILGLDPSNVKALYRKAIALRATEDVAAAEAALKQAAELAPEDTAVQKELADIARHRKKDKDNEKRLAKKMFG